MNVTAIEASVLRCIVDVAEEHDVAPRPFIPHVGTARAKLNGVARGEVAFTPTEASAVLAAVQAYLDNACTDSMPLDMAEAINSVWRKLRLVQKDQPVAVLIEDNPKGHGWYLVINGAVLHGPFESCERAMFFWEVRPCQMAS